MSTPLARWCAPALAACLAAAQVAAGEDEPGAGDIVSGDTAFGQEAGELELAFETNFTNGREERELECVVGFEYGITDRVQLEIAWPYLFVDPDDEDEPSTDGFDRADVGLLFGILAEGAPMALSVAGEASVPIAGRDGPGDDVVALSAAVLAALVHGSTEYAMSVKRSWSDEPDEVEVQGGVVWGFEKTAAAVEVAWTGTREEKSWEVKPEVVFDDVSTLELELSVGLPVSFGDSSESWGIAFGVTWGYP